MTAYELRISDWSSYVCSSDLQLLVAAIQRRGFEERPKHRNIAEPWQLVDAVIEAGADEAGNHERLAVTEFDRRVRAPHRQRRDRDAAALDDRKSNRLYSSP